MEMVVDGQGGPVFLRDTNVGVAQEAYHDFTGGNISETYDFLWHTDQVATSGDPSVPDGYRTVRIAAYDDMGQQGSRQRRFLVDNYPPAAPGAPTQTVIPTGYALSDKVVWGQALDGTDAAAKYEVAFVKDTAGAATLSGWTTVGTYEPSPLAATSLAAGVDPFSRYVVMVRAGSPRATSGGTQSWSGWTESAEAKITPPFLQGTSVITETKSKGKSFFGFKTTFGIPAVPAWATAGSAHYDLYRAQGNGAFSWVANVTGSAGGTYMDTAPTQGPLGNNVSPLPYTYQLRIDVTPKGYKAAGEESVWSNKATTGVAATASANLTPSW